MKTNLTNWLCGLCAILLIAVLAFQFNQQGRLDALQRQQESLSSTVSQQQQQQRDLAAGLANQVTNLGVNLESRLAQGEEQEKAQQDDLRNLSNRVLSLGTNWEAALTPRLNAKADDVVAAFSTRLNDKATEAATQVASVIRHQAEAALTASATERSNKTARLLEAANRYEKSSRQELAELCYLSAFKCSEGNAGLVLKPFLAWQERNFAGLSETDVLTSGAAKLMALYEALDKALPESIALPDDMELALSAAEKIRARITERQQAKMADVRKVLSWDQFDFTRRPIYEQSKETLISFAPVNQTLEQEKNELSQTADNLIQTATALSPVSVADLLPPSPKAPTQVLTNWFDRGLELVDSPTNTVEARLAGLSVLMDFAHQQTNCGHYAEALTNKSVMLACAQWAGRVREYGTLPEKLDKRDADTIALGQSLLNQGFAMLKSFPDRSLTAEVAAQLPGLASKLASQREMLLVSQMHLTAATNAFSSKEQAARARSMVYGQLLSGVLDLRNLQDEVAKACGTTSERLATLKGVEGRFGEYLASYEKLDKGDMADAKADQIVKSRQQHRRYADHCQGKINLGQQCYTDAKAVADEWFAKWGNERAQSTLRQGLVALYSVDVNDLKRADPGVAAEWSRIEDLLKKNYAAKPSKVNAETPKKSLNDF